MKDVRLSGSPAASSSSPASSATPRETVLSLIPRRWRNVSWLMWRHVPMGIQRKISAIRTRAVAGRRAWVMVRVSRAWLMPS